MEEVRSLLRRTGKPLPKKVQMSTYSYLGVLVQVLGAMNPYGGEGPRKERLTPQEKEEMESRMQQCIAEVGGEKLLGAKPKAKPKTENTRQ